MMLRIAEALARQTKAKALVSGESLAQVASQTLDNMAVIQQAATLPILRPLVGMDKQEIIDQARRIGTFDISSIPDQRLLPALCTEAPGHQGKTWGSRGGGVDLQSKGNASLWIGKRH